MVVPKTATKIAATGASCTALCRRGIYLCSRKVTSKKLLLSVYFRCRRLNNQTNTTLTMKYRHGIFNKKWAFCKIKFSCLNNITCKDSNTTRYCITTFQFNPRITMPIEYFSLTNVHNKD